MKDVTNKYINMIEAFECDFSLAKSSYRKISYLQDGIDKKDENLMEDINLLEELSFGLRHGFLKIYDVRGEN